MSELLVFALKFAFLALLWVFILFTGAVIRSDLFGRRVPAAKAEAPPTPRAAERTRRRAREASTGTTGWCASGRIPALASTSIWAMRSSGTRWPCWSTFYSLPR